MAQRIRLIRIKGALCNTDTLLALGERGHLEVPMKALNLITLVLVIIGGVNWGLVGLFDVDLVAMILGAGTWPTRIVYMLVGISALWQLVPLSQAITSDEPPALRAR
jgi:uncharacterized protein